MNSDSIQNDILNYGHFCPLRKQPIIIITAILNRKLNLSSTIFRIPPAPKLTHLLP